MQNMLERITAAEKEADQILEQANAQAREMIARTKAECAAETEKAHAEELQKTVDAMVEAEKEGEQNAELILADVQNEIAKIREAASAQMSKAAAYLMERIETTL